MKFEEMPGISHEELDALGRAILALAQDMQPELEDGILHDLDNLTPCDVCKRTYLLYRRVKLGDRYFINPECSTCYEEKSSVSIENFPAWCEQYHPELLSRERIPLKDE